MNLAVLLTLLLTVAGATPPTLTKNDPLSWMRVDSDVFACFLEKNFGAHDKTFRCGAKLSAKLQAGDSGPPFPAEKSSEVNLLVSDVELEWEHGQLRMVTLTLPRKLTKAEVYKIFHFPDDQHLPPNVMSISVQDCSQKDSCVLIQGFDHQGAGD